MPPIEVVLFDLGGTLIYFDGDWSRVASRANRALLEVLTEAGPKLDPSAFLADLEGRLEIYFSNREVDFTEITTAQILREALERWGYTRVPETLIGQALKARYAVSQAHWHSEPEAQPTLQTLQARGYRMGVISNAGDDADVQALVDKAALRPYLDLVLSSAACGVRKPARRIFEIALDHWGVEPGQAVMVGDTLEADILGARRAGIFSIWITRRADTPTSQKLARTLAPDAKIENLAQLPDLLARLAAPP